MATPRQDSDDDLKAKIAKHFKEPRVDEDIWDYLRDVGYVSDARRPNGYSDLEVQYGRLRRLRGSRPAAPAGRAMAGREPPSPERLFPDDSAEGRRAAIFNRFVMREVARVPAVRTFRHATLNEPLRPHEADALARSAAAALLSRDRFFELDVPLFAVAQLERYEERREAGQWEGSWTLFVNPPGHRVEGTFSAALPTDTPVPHLPWQGLNDQPVFRPCWPGSLLDELRTLAENVSQVFPLEPAQVAWLVLTDDPGVEPLRVRTGRVGYPGGYSRGRIELLVDPWVSASTVERAYRLHQRWMLVGEGNRSGDNRRITDRDLAIFEFIEERPEAGSSRVTFRQLARRWNARLNDLAGDDPRRKWQFADPTDLDKFKRAYDRTGERLLSPQYGFFGDEPDPPGQASWWRFRHSTWD